MPLGGTLGNLLLRGLLAGLIAGLLAGAVAYTLGEPHVEAAIALEESTPSDTAGHGHDDATSAHSHSDTDEPLVSRDEQRAGLILATALGGLAVGALFGVAAHFLRRFATMPGARFALALAGAGWLAVEAVPFFTYPANPPAVGDPETIDERTLLWLAALTLGLVAVAAAGCVAKALAAHRYWSLRLTAATAAFLAIVEIGYLVMPNVDEVGDDFPATLLWQFRVSSLATQATLWLALGLTFAFLTERAQRIPHRYTGSPRRTAPAPRVTRP